MTDREQSPLNVIELLGNPPVCSNIHDNIIVPLSAFEEIVLKAGAINNKTIEFKTQL